MIRFLSAFAALLCFLPFPAFGLKKQISAQRTTEKIIIDGRLDEASWTTTPAADQFITYSPKMGDPAAQATEVRIIYNNHSVFFGVKLYDFAPDSIKKELAKRDNISNANTDKFRITLNPYNDGQNLFHFEVSAANVQADYKKRSSTGDEPGEMWGHGDFSWNAVWSSAVEITDEGWILEVEIPYAAVRFPKVDIQTWGVNFQRTVRRSREISTWNPVDRSFSEDDQVGELMGISSIKAPLRLELYPFAAGYYQITPEGRGFSYAAGMDLKYGINEAYTLDMTLIPDFGQRKSDQIILNLTPFEVKYTENRQFFTEGMELFNKSDLFYSRRIGKQPINYYEAWGDVKEGGELLENPSETQLINATKISGRNSKKLGVGFFNAMTANTFATIRDPEGGERRFLTDPFSNYNMLVFDQIIGRNSFINVSNTNAFTPSTTRMANASSLTARFRDSDNRYGVSGDLAGTMIFDSLQGKPVTGYRAGLGLGKYRGSFNYGYSLELISDQYNPNDMGYLRKNNFISHTVDLAYRVLEPVGTFNSINNGLKLEFEQIFEPRAFYQFTGSLSTHFLFRDYSDISLTVRGSPFYTHDWYEPRAANRYVEYPEYLALETRGSTDYRKKLAFNGGFGWFINGWGDQGYSWNFGPRFRFNDKLSIFPSIRFNKQMNDRGFVDLVSQDSIVFGRRDVKTITNSITGSYIFNNKAGLSISLRHYWSEVDYKQYYLLSEDGKLLDFADYPENEDLNFNIFTIDLEYAWNFAPGSYLTAVWKNNISHSDEIMNDRFMNYWDNLHGTLVSPQTNSFSIKISYYFDYKRITRKPEP